VKLGEDGWGRNEMKIFVTGHFSSLNVYQHGLSPNKLMLDNLSRLTVCVL